MKRRHPLVSILTLVVTSLMAGTATASVALTFGADVTPLNCDDAVPLSMTGSGGAVAGVQIDMLIPFPAFVPVGDNPCTLGPGVAGTVTSALTTSPAPPAGMQRLRIIILDFGGATYADGLLATCKLRAATSTPTGTYVMTADGAMASDSSGNILPATGGNGEVTVTAPAFCCS